MAAIRKAWLESLRAEAAQEKTTMFYVTWCAEVWMVHPTTATYRLRQLRKLGWVTLHEHIRYPVPQPAIYKLTKKGLEV
jgi:DNA-binding PadR family transcriptional regulator